MPDPAIQLLVVGPSLPIPPFFIWFVTSLLNSSVDTVKKKVSLVLLLSLPYSQGCQGYHREGTKKVRGNTTQKRQVERRMQPPLACQHSSNCNVDIFQGIFLSTRCCIRQKIKFTVDLLFNDNDDFLLASLFLFLATYRTSVNQLGFFFSVQTSPNNNLLCQSTHTRIQSLCVSVHKDRLRTRLHRDKLKDTLAARHRAPQSRPDLFHVLQIIDFEISSGSALASSGRFLSFFKLPWFRPEKEKWLEGFFESRNLTRKDRIIQITLARWPDSTVSTSCEFIVESINFFKNPTRLTMRVVCRCNVINLTSISNLVTSLDINERAQETKMQTTSAHVPFHFRLSVCQRNEFLLGLFSWLSRSITDPRKRRKTTISLSDCMLLSWEKYLFCVCIHALFPCFSSFSSEITADHHVRCHIMMTTCHLLFVVVITASRQED
jgi:hypothetical protein